MKEKANFNEEWEAVSSRVRAVFNFGIEKSEWFENSRMARFITAIPYLAGCDKARETAFTHLSIYVMSLDDSVKEIYFHRKEDDGDIFSRLLPISNFHGGDRKIIGCCLDLIALNMISNYNKDSSDDKTLGKYNPVAEGVWDYSAVSDELIGRIKGNLTDDIAEFYTIEDATPGVWKD